MEAYCSFCRLSTAFTVCTLYCSAEGSGLLLLPFVHSFHDGLYAVSLILPVVYDFHNVSRAVSLSSWQCIARSSARRRFSRFACCIAQWMAADCSSFHSSTAFTTVCTQYCSVAGSRFLILLLVNGFHNICAPYCSMDGTVLLVLPLVDGFYGLRAVLLRGWQQIVYSSVVNCFPNAFLGVLLSGWQRIAHSFTHEQLSRWFAHCIAQPMAVHCSFVHSLTDFPTICTPYSSADGNVSHFLPLVNGIHGLRTVLLSGWHHVPYSSTRQRVSCQFALHIAYRMAAHCSFFHSSKAFQTIRAPYCLDGSEFLVLQLANGFHNGLCALLS